jgi:hypothetical protein
MEVPRKGAKGKNSAIVRLQEKPQQEAHNWVPFMGQFTRVDNPETYLKEVQCEK